MNSKALILSAAACFALAACGDFERGKPLPVAPAGPAEQDDDTNKPDDGGTPVTDTTDGGDATGLSFAADVHALLISNCNTCHGPTNSTAFKLTGEAEADLATVLALADLDAPENSTILKKPSGQTSHGGGAVMDADSEDYATVLQWLIDGGKP